MVSPTEGSTRPNFVVILVDDMGFSDIGCFGAEIATPNLDSMARRGAVFTQMYNCARCCPTRASLLTGLYPHQAGVGHMVGNDGIPGYQGYLRKDAVTIAEALKAGGYRTYLSGKWHVGGSYDAARPQTWRPGEEGRPIPVQRGFDHHYGFLAGATSFFNPHTLIRDDTFIRPEPPFYFTDAISDNACTFLEDAAGGEEPFFLFTAYTAPHWPLHALEEDIARYEGKYRGGWDEARTRRHETLRGLGICDPKWDISPRDEQAPPWDGLPADRRDWEDLRMAVYAAQIDRMDQGVGRILAKLREKGMEENTVVMFLADNGGCAEFLAEDGHCQNYGYDTLEGRKVKVGNHMGLRPGPATTFMSYDLPWANASNAPFRLYKHWVHEGGIATPLLVQWPEKVKPGTRSDAPCHVIDIMATCLDAAGVAYPEQYDGNAIQPLEGESLVPAMRGQEWQRERPIFFEHEGNRAVRLGRWKLVSKHPYAWELYDMVEDRTELNDLALSNAPQAAKMAKLYDEYASTHDVMDWDKLRDLRRERDRKRAQGKQG